jgi:hypothetical protein
MDMPGEEAPPASVRYTLEGGAPLIALLALSLLGCDGKSGVVSLPDSAAPAGETGAEDSAPPDSPPPDPCEGRAGETWCDGQTSTTCGDDGALLAQIDCDADTVCADGAGCVSCELALRAAWAAPGEEAAVALTPPLDEASFGWGRLALRPLTLEADPALAGEVELRWEAPLVLYTPDGARLESPAALAVQGLEVLAGAEEAGGAEVIATWLPADPEVSCASEHALALRGEPLGVRAGRALAGAPWFEAAGTFSRGDPLSVALDPTRHGERAGLEAEVLLVPHRSPEQWAEDPSLGDAISAGIWAPPGGASLEGNTLTFAAPEELEDPLGVGFDLVLDYGLDGALDPGDLALGPGGEAPALVAVGDLGVLGPHEVVTEDYSGGRWLGQRLYWPADVAGGDEPAHLVVVSHGNGHDYTWYDWLGEHLASWGYVVMAHQNNTGPGIETASETTLTNTDYLLGHLDAVAGGALEGRLDGEHIAWIGHSRGGEGVTRAYDRLFDGEYTPEQFDAGQIALISSIAPTVFLGVDDSNPHEVFYHLIAGAADGDVNGSPGCEQCQFFRIARAATGPVAVQYLHGVGHNDFNCCGFDDATGPELAGRALTQEFARRYYLALLEWRLGEREWLGEYFTRADDNLRPYNPYGEITVASTWHEARAEVAALDDFQSELDLEIASSGAAVAIEGEAPAELLLKDLDDRLSWSELDPANGMTQAEDRDDTDRGLTLGWAAGESASVTWTLDGPQDWTGYTWLSLRACQITRHPDTVALDGALAFTVTVADAEGGAASASTGDYAEITRPYQRTGSGPGEGWANEFSTVRLRLDALSAGVDLARVSALTLSFGGEAGSAQGRVAVDDVELVP